MGVVCEIDLFISTRCIRDVCNMIIIGTETGMCDVIKMNDRGR